MSPPSPLLSIVVPTRNRHHTALLTVQTLLRMPERRLEVVVQDCGDDDRLTRAISESISDPRLIYRRGTPVSMTSNWNAAMELVSGDYVSFIGDDDGVHPDIVLATKWADRNGLDAVASPRPAWFCWSDYPVPEMASTLWLDRFEGNLTYPDGPEEVRLSSFGFGQRIHKLPRVYHGIVKRRVLEELRRRTGTYFDGLAPDFYAAYAVGAVAARYCMVDFPLTIAGASRSSNAGRSNDPRYDKKSAFMLHVGEYRDLSVPDIVPTFPGYASCVSTSMLLAFQNLGRTDLMANVDLPLLYASALMTAPGERLATLSEFFSAVRKMKRPLMKSTAMLSACWIGRGVQRPTQRLRSAIRRVAHHRLARGVNDIVAATDELTRHYGRASESFPQSWIEVN
jgi:glycosyltransferase involved in cell wall biosynthesis